MGYKMRYCVGLPDYVFKLDVNKDNFRTWLVANTGTENVFWRYILGNGYARGICFVDEQHLITFMTTFGIMGNRFNL